jgi:hypothetical protein
LRHAEQPRLRKEEAAGATCSTAWMGGGDRADRLAYEVTAIAPELFPGVSFPRL